MSSKVKRAATGAEGEQPKTKKSRVISPKKKTMPKVMQKKSPKKTTKNVTRKKKTTTKRVMRRTSENDDILTNTVTMEISSPTMDNGRAMGSSEESRAQPASMQPGASNSTSAATTSSAIPAQVFLSATPPSMTSTVMQPTAMRPTTMLPPTAVPPTTTLSSAAYSARMYPATTTPAAVAAEILPAVRQGCVSYMQSAEAGTEVASRGTLSYVEAPNFNSEMISTQSNNVNIAINDIASNNRNIANALNSNLMNNNNIFNVPNNNHASVLNNGNLRNVSTNDTASDPVARLADVLSATLLSFRDAAAGQGAAFSVNRSAKPLPTFAGNPIEWLHFKQAYILATEINILNANEKMSLLFAALQGEAREIVSSLLATSRDAATIIKTLELHYGNKHVIARKLISDLNNLPHLESGSITLTRFASRLQNTVQAFKALELIGYLHSPELIRNIASKLPSALKYSYNAYAAMAQVNKTDLEKLADFLFKEAKLAVAGGIFNCENDAISQSGNVKKRMRPIGANVYAVAHEATTSRCTEKSSEATCVICNRGNHSVEYCTSFIHDTLARRWFLIRRLRLCFKCLKQGHTTISCTARNCERCSKPHHVLLHNATYNKFSQDKRKKIEKNAQKRDNEPSKNKAEKD